MHVVLLRLTLLALTALVTPASAFEISLAQIPGKRIDANWYRYENPRFGTAIDIPAWEYQYYAPVNSSGLALGPKNSEVEITIYSHWVTNLMFGVSFENADPFEDIPTDPRISISRIFDRNIEETKRLGGTVTYSVKKDTFYVMSGTFHDGTYTYYERVIISPRCPKVFNSLRIFHPTTDERSLDKLVTRLSRSMRATCRGADNAGNLWWLANDGLKPLPGGTPKPQ